MTTVAGGYVGDGKPATSAALAGPVGVAVDAKGNLYIGDSGHCRIRRVNPKGVISTFAGTGICGYSGDGGPAKSAKISAPAGLVFDGQSNLLFADQGNSRIRKITPGGTISTFAGDGSAGYSGDGGLATQASLRAPTGAAVDPSGDVYIADASNFVVRMVDTAGIIHTVAGNHTFGFSGDGGPATSAQMGYPESVVVDGGGDLYIADGDNGRVRRVESSGKITTYAGSGASVDSGNGGPATGAGLGFLRGLLLTGGNLYISTNTNIWAVDQATGTANIVAGSTTPTLGFNGDGNPALATSFFDPWGMAVNSIGDLLVADASNARVRMIDTSQVVSTIAGGYVGDAGPAATASLNLGFPTGQIAFDPAGNLYIPDTNNNRIRKVSPSGTITTLAGTGIGGYSGDGGPASAATLYQPTAVTIDGHGNVLIADGNAVIRKVDGSGTITTYVSTVTVPAPWGGTIALSVYASGLALDASGNLYAATFGDGVILKIAPDGSGSIVAGVLFRGGYNGDGIQATQAYLNLPVGVACDSEGSLYIADWENLRIRKVDTSGVISTVVGNGIQGFGGDGGPATAANLTNPAAVVLDAQGNMYIADSLNYRVRRVNAAGTIQTLAGSGMWGYNGNNLPATAANMLPVGLALSPNGVIYLTDAGSERVRKIH